MEEKKRILEMVAEQKITAEEATKLLQVLNSPQKKTSKAKKLHLEITQDKHKKPLLNLSIPISLAKVGIHFFPKSGKIQANMNNSNFDFSSIDWKEIMSLVTNNEDGDLFYMDVDEDDGSSTQIRIYID